MTSANCPWLSSKFFAALRIVHVHLQLPITKKSCVKQSYLRALATFFASCCKSFCTPKSGDVVRFCQDYLLDRLAPQSQSQLDMLEHRLELDAIQDALLSISYNIGQNFTGRCVNTFMIQ